MRVGRGTKGCCHLLSLSCLLVGCAWLCMVVHGDCFPASWIGTVVRPVFHFDMDTDDTTRKSAQIDEQHPWLEYSVWQDQEWVRIYTPGQAPLWHPEKNT